jgi:hypothetical protein
VNCTNDVSKIETHRVAAQQHEHRIYDRCHGPLDWFSRELGTMGPGYLGFVRWATGRDKEPEFKPLRISVSALR